MGRLLDDLHWQADLTAKAGPSRANDLHRELTNRHKNLV